MRSKDVIYSSSATAVEAANFMILVRTILATVNDPIVYATNGYALNAPAHGGATNVFTSPTPISLPSTTVVVPRK